MIFLLFWHILLYPAEPAHIPEVGGSIPLLPTSYYKGLQAVACSPFCAPLLLFSFDSQGLPLTHPQYLSPNQFLQAVKIIDILQKISRSEKESGSVSKKGKMARRWGYLPAELKPLFWDHDFHRLRWEKDRDLIIGRLISHGDWNALIWLRSQVDSASLREWLLNRRGADLSSRQLRFWELILELPHRQVNEWLKDKGRMVWERRAR